MFRRRVSPRRVVVEDHIISFHISPLYKSANTNNEEEDDDDKAHAPNTQKTRVHRWWCSWWCRRSDAEKSIYIKALLLVCSICVYLFFYSASKTPDVFCGVETKKKVFRVCASLGFRVPSRP